MKEICGFLDIDGNFHKTESEAKQANAKIKIRKIESFLDKFEREVSWIIFKASSTFVEHDEITHLRAMEQKIYDAVSRMILSNSKEWQEIIKQKEELKKELTILKVKNVYNKWWLKIKWW